MSAPTDRTAERLSADGRRTALLEVAKDLVLEDGTAAVTMGAVAERAEVTRALVYKHFRNKDDLLVALFRREAATLDHTIRHQVDAAPPGFESKLRGLLSAVLDAEQQHAAFFQPLRGVRGHDEVRGDQRRWDRRTVGYYTDLAVAEFEVDADAARAMLSVLFAGIVTLRARARGRPADRAFLVDTFVAGTIGALERLASR